jgi:hypothetical protein
MLVLKEQDYEDLDKIHKFLSLGDWEEATQKASKLIEDLFQRIYRELASSVPPEKFAERLQPGQAILEKPGKPFSPETMTLGDLIILFKQSDLFGFYSEKTGCDFSEVRSLNWDKIRRIRNSVSHGGKDKIKPADAYFVVATLHLFLRTATNWEPRKPKDWLSRYLTSKLKPVIIFI